MKINYRFVRSLLLIFFGLFLIAAIIKPLVDSQEHPLAAGTSFQPINLVKLSWYARQGFSNEFVGGFDTNQQGVKKINSFPIRLNTIFNVQPGNSLNEYTLMTSFQVSTEGVNQSLMLFLGELGENWVVYLNGKQINNEIYLDANGQMILHRTIARAYIPIPPGSIFPGTNTLVFRILGNAPANNTFSGWMPGLSLAENYKIEQAGDLILQRSTEDAVSWFQIGMYVILCLTQFFFFVRQKEKYSFYFSAFLLTCIVYSYTMSNSAYAAIPDTALIIRLMYSSNVSWLILLSLTIWRFLHKQKPIPLGMHTVIILSVIVIILIFLLPVPWVETTMYATLILFGVGVIYLATVDIQAVRQHIPDANKLLFAGIFVFIIVLYSILDMVLIRSGIDLTGWIPFFLAIAFSMIMIDRFWRMGAEMRESNDLLSQFNAEMEGQIAARTAELRTANADLEDKLEEIGLLQENLRELSIHDPLTGLFNRRFLDEIVDKEFSRAKRDKHCISLIMLDIDHFKALNDTYGHRGGDEMLRMLSETILNNVRHEDYVFRYGGEEFLIILVGAFMYDAVQRANGLRQKIEQSVLRYEGHDLTVTISAGVADFPACGLTPDEVIKAADSALYQAKTQGRNRVETAKKS